MNELIQIDLAGLTVFVNTEEQLGREGAKESFFGAADVWPQLDAKLPLDINDTKSGLIEKVHPANAGVHIDFE